MRKLAFLLIIALLAIAVIPALAQDEEEGMPEFIEHSECQVDLTDETVTIFHLGDISSPGYSPITLPLLAGLEDAANYFNARGGICGAEIGQANFDTGGDPTRTSAGYEQLMADDPDLIVLYSSADSELLRPTLAEDQIPALISAGSLPGLYGENGDEPGWVYATNPLYADQFAMFCEYVADNPETFPEPVIGYMGWGGPVAAFGLAAFTEESTAYCESLGIEVIDEPQTFLPIADATAVSGLVESHINAGATIIYVNALASGPVRVAEALELIGFSGEISLASVNWGLDTSSALLSAGSTRASDGKPVIDGIYGSMPFYWYSDTDEPGIQLILEQAELNERSITTQGISYILGWSLVDTYIEMYIQAANAVAEEQGLTDATEVIEAIDGVLIRDVIETMVYEPLSLYPFDYQGGEIRALPSNRIVQMFVDSPEITEPPLLEQLTDFRPAPDTRAMMFEEMGE